jgi:hypothetical protein
MLTIQTVQLEGEWQRVPQTYLLEYKQDEYDAGRKVSMGLLYTFTYLLTAFVPDYLFKNVYIEITLRRLSLSVCLSVSLSLAKRMHTC